MKRAIATAVLLLMLSGAATAEKTVTLTEAQLAVLEGILDGHLTLIEKQQQYILRLLEALNAEKSKVCI